MQTPSSCLRSPEDCLLTELVSFLQEVCQIRLPDPPHRALFLHVDMRFSGQGRQRARGSPLAAVGTIAHTPGFLYYM